MGVVRREGDWRLEKRRDGVYEVTRREEPRMTVLTPEYSPDRLGDWPRDFASDVRLVDSFSEAESLFEETAAGSPPPRGTDIDAVLPNAGDDQSNGGAGTEDPNLGDAPNGVVFPVLLAAGAYLAYSTGFSPNDLAFLLGVSLVVTATGGLAWGLLLYRKKGAEAATKFLWTGTE
ncbi:MAG: hypothetical protein V5A46_08015 [Haloferacaceae archaeon]